MNDQPTSTALATLANIDDLTEGRERAIALWLDAYDTLHANTEAAGRASIGGAIALSAGYDRNERDKVTPAFLNILTKSHRDRETYKETTETGREHFARIITQEVDRRCWSHLMKHLGFDQLLDRQAREEFEEGLRNDPVPFTSENCTATFGHVWGNRREMYLRGIANVFMAMDRRFRSHDAFALGNRLVIDGAFNVWGSWERYERRDTLRDVERIFLELDGQPPHGYDHAGAIHNQIYKERETARRLGDFPAMVEGEFFRVRAFKNGNLHLWFTRKDLLKQINALLLEYYKPLEGDVGEGPSYEAGPLYHPTPAKYFGAFNSSADVAERVIGMAEIRDGDLVLEPSAGTGVLAKAARAAGGKVACVEVQPGLAHELRALHGFPDTREDDFLRVDPSRFPAFDRIVMNPPFDRGRDCDHVRHAFRFLKPGGRLVAVMSARAEFGTDARHKALHDLVESCTGKWGNARHYWHDLPEKSFAHAGTNVNTVMLCINKPA